jgi:hypothetical protein
MTATNCYHVCVVHFTAGTIPRAVLDIQVFANNDAGKDKCVTRAATLRHLLALPDPLPECSNNDQRIAAMNIRTALGIPRCVCRVEPVHYKEVK